MGDEFADGPVYTHEFDTDVIDPNVDVVSVIADLEDTPAENLPPLYECIDHLVEHLFSNPPAPDADTRISFSYHGYRITIDQRGFGRFDRLPKTG